MLPYKIPQMDSLELCQTFLRVIPRRLHHQWTYNLLPYLSRRYQQSHQVLSPKEAS